MVGWLENWKVIPISAFNYVIVEVVAEIGKNVGVLNHCLTSKGVKSYLIVFRSVKTQKTL